MVLSHLLLDIALLLGVSASKRAKVCFIVVFFFNIFFLHFVFVSVHYLVHYFTLPRRRVSIILHEP